jgi:hypothetical protein
MSPWRFPKSCTGKPLAGWASSGGSGVSGPGAKTFWGCPYKEISTIIPVGKSTSSGWCRDLEFTAEQSARLRALNNSETGRRKAGKTLHNRNLERVAAIRSAARSEARLSLHPLGIQLPWPRTRPFHHRVTSPRWTGRGQAKGVLVVDYRYSFEPVSKESSLKEADIARISCITAPPRITLDEAPTSCTG